MDYDILKDLIESRYSINQIANELGVCGTTVRYWINNYELSLWREAKGKTPDTAVRCKCGETDPSQFYTPYRKFICKKCHNKYTIANGLKKRLYAIEKLGGKCTYCNYDNYHGALDIHHLDRTRKDPTFKAMRSWTYDRIDKELEVCILLCKIHHVELEAGIIQLPIV